MIRYFLFPFCFFILIFYGFLFVPVLPIQNSAQEKILNIQKGTSGSQIISELKKNDLIHKYFPYKLLYRWSAFQAGEYRFYYGMSPYFIFKKISQGDVIHYDLTFQEGLNMFEMAQMLEENNIMTSQEFLKASQDSELIQELLGERLESLEGYLYPNTYRLYKGFSGKKLVQIMVQEFLSHYEKLTGFENSPLTRHQIVIFSSLIEKETGVAEERDLIASVFYNRIDKGMKFQSDPTILYGMLRKDGFHSNNIRKKDILEPTPYNTYVVKGFPKGPIGNPGKESLYATLNPQKTNYLYFVSRNDGTHIFSTNLKDHNKAVNKYQRSQK